ncbi:uncharacterized protein FA14DRAFT_183264 [Meira miltonrushii]|uniref:Uncharacterized protein n=1 Tax=Meira miltonrushii TaxID=1280837 RepID=A0A316VGW9_9BASI|nr:uncharacterized protein FA14DRAFT_183264 [Meira miltonrushii]PWN36897.1 hypothetical protein FA14DRAFT_183264 [Meira miltonrushii]
MADRHYYDPRDHRRTHESAPYESPHSSYRTQSDQYRPSSYASSQRWQDDQTAPPPLPALSAGGVNRGSSSSSNGGRMLESMHYHPSSHSRYASPPPPENYPRQSPQQSRTHQRAQYADYHDAPQYSSSTRPISGDRYGHYEDHGYDRDSRASHRGAAYEEMPTRYSADPHSNTHRSQSYHQTRLPSSHHTSAIQRQPISPVPTHHSPHYSARSHIQSSPHSRYESAQNRHSRPQYDMDGDRAAYNQHYEPDRTLCSLLPPPPLKLKSLDQIQITISRIARAHA